MKLYEELSHAYATDYASGLKNVELHLGERCALSHDATIWYVKQTNGTWSALKGKAARQSMIENWSGRDPLLGVVTEKDIDDFMKNSFPVVRGTMKIPSSTALIVEIEGEKYINTWRNTMVQPDAEAAHDLLLRPYLTLLFRVMRESLCARDDIKTLEEMLAIANGDDPEEVEFRYLVASKAAVVQKPGINLQTNLWLVGELGGSGKGTLFRVMSMIFGVGNSAQLNGEDVENGGYTEAVAGKLNVNVNEIKQSKGARAYDWNSFIKQNTCEDTVLIRQRYHDSYQAINFANWTFHCNIIDMPRGIFDAFDRRNMLIETTSNKEKIKLATEFRQWLEHAKPAEVERLLSGFVYLLHSVKVNWAMLDSAPMTSLKKEIQEATSDMAELEYFLINDRTYPRDVWVAAKDLVTYYKTFNQLTKDVRVTGRIFGAKLSRLAKKKLIEKERTDPRDKRAARYRISSDRYPADGPGENPKSRNPQVIALPNPSQIG